MFVEPRLRHTREVQVKVTKQVGVTPLIVSAYYFFCHSKSSASCSLEALKIGIPEQVT